MTESREDVDLIEPGDAPEPQPPATTAPEQAPATASPDTPAPADEVDPLDALLEQFDREAGARTTPAAPEQQQQTDPLQDRQPNGAPPPADSEAVASVHRAYQAEIERAQLVQDFEQYCAGRQEKVPDYMPSDYYRSEMIAMAATDPRLEIAIRAQHMNVNQTAVRVELDKVNAALKRAAHDPVADPRVIPGLQQLKWQLEISYHARTILKQTEAAIIAKAQSRPPIDVEATLDREAVTFAVRSAGGKIAAEPAPNLGQMSDNELREYTRQFGF
jgi:hypothetical protein